MCVWMCYSYLLVTNCYVNDAYRTEQNKTAQVEYYGWQNGIRTAFYRQPSGDDENFVKKRAKRRYQSKEIFSLLYLFLLLREFDYSRYKNYDYCLHHSLRSILSIYIYIFVGVFALR